MKSVVEKYYSAGELAALIGFAARFWRERMKDGSLVLVDSATQATIAEPVEIAGEFFAPASAVNAYLARHAVAPALGTKARNAAELRRKVASGQPDAALAA